MSRMCREKKKGFPWIDIPIALLIGFIITCVGVVILAFCLFLFPISEEMVEGGVLIIYMVSCYTAGLIIGKKQKNKRFLWGMCIGIMYYSLLNLTAYFVIGSSQSIIADVITTLLVCCISATIGGMLS